MPDQPVDLIDRFEVIPIGEIVLDRFQVRKRQVDKNIEDLEFSIRKKGLLQPILVATTSDHPGFKYELIAGQRRMLAHQNLGREQISAGIIEGPVSEEEGIALSGLENICRADMTRPDLQDFCANLYYRYGAYNAVADATGIPLHVVKQYVKFDGLPDDLKKMVRSKELSVELATKVEKAASAATGTYDPDKAAEIVGELRPVDDALRKEILKTQTSNPHLPVSKAVEIARTPKKEMKLRITLKDDEATAMGTFASDEGTSANDAAYLLVVGGLDTKGYLGVD